MVNILKICILFLSDLSIVKNPIDQKRQSCLTQYSKCQLDFQFFTVQYKSYHTIHFVLGEHFKI